MKKVFYILLITLTLINCDKTIKKDHGSTKETFYYPRMTSFQNDSLLKKVEIDSLKNFGELLKLTDEIVCDNKIPMIYFENEKAEFKFLMGKECLIVLNIADYKERNVIFIQGDSIIINDKITKPLDNIDKVLKKHILNNGKDPKYSTSIEESIIFYHQDSSFKSQDIKKQLLKISYAFHEMRKTNGDSIPLKMKLQDYGYIYVEEPPIPIE
ncbi:hypothetical protein [Christiangramia echinicola]|uniref:Uncharacterized protein n=1 Tax=Christiangramia echinicola TaxID=279359 RepID=A0A1H1LAP9_9FLAO|nr:hypothetical protein [Christiangramia echinicola]SDR71671.1 hypothetical protein SAMN04488552_0675 [Christiangramia echinicola]